MLTCRHKENSSGPDNTPYWLFKYFAIELTPAVTHIMNLTLHCGTSLALLWERAVITPVPKITRPELLSDFRPISVTPLLLCIIERLIVKKFLLSFLPAMSLRDHFAYCPTV